MARTTALKPVEEKPTGTWSRSIEFERSRETKNKVVFVESDEPVVVGTLYVSKAFDTDMGKPEKITVTINPTV
jgi:hypothetical protein